MATLNFKNINKIYPNNVQAVFDFNLDIQDKEFIVFVGPSGCGKSTTLRMVAGLEEITSGKLYIDNLVMNDVEPMDRGIAMVFQNYALYPTMNVYKNMSFSLRMRRFPQEVLDKEGNNIIVVDASKIKKINSLIKQTENRKKEIIFEEKIENKAAMIRAKQNGETYVKPERNEKVTAALAELDEKIVEYKKQIEEVKANPSAKKVKMVHMNKAEIDERVKKASKILGLDEYLDRKPAALSGGQRQRVALGRAIVRNPKVFLMDEPLSNLDAKLRVQTRAEIIKIHNEVGATTIYVTHDQTEAMTMADRIVVMKSGYVQQIATPKEVYEHPENLFVATFIGSPSMNVLKASLNKNVVSLGDALKIKLDKDFAAKYQEFYKKQIEIAEATLIQVNKELDTLNILGKKKNIKAIEQRNKIVENKQNILEFAKKVLAGETDEVLVGIRPEDIYMVNDSRNTNPSGKITLAVESVELLGQESIVYSQLAGQQLILKVPSAYNVKAKSNIDVCINLDCVHVFDPASTLTLK